MTTRTWPTDNTGDFIERSPGTLASIKAHACAGHFGFAMRLRNHLIATAAMVELKAVLDRYWKGGKP